MGTHLPIFGPGQFWAEMQGYSFTFSPTMSNFLSRNFWVKFFSFLSWLKFGQKCKPIALLFGQKLACFPPQNFGKKFLHIFSWSNLAKMQGYSLTFWPKISYFWSRNFWVKICPFFHLVNFGLKCKAIALLFGQKLDTFGPEIFGYKFAHFLIWSILGKNARL